MAQIGKSAGRATRVFTLTPDRHHQARRHPQLCSESRMAFEFTFAVAARVLLALSPLGSYLQDDDQLSSPLTSYSRRRYTPNIPS